MSRTRKETKEERVFGIRDLGFLLLRGYNSSLEGHAVYIERQNQEGFCCVCWNMWLWWGLESTERDMGCKKGKHGKQVRGQCFGNNGMMSESMLHFFPTQLPSSLSSFWAAPTRKLVKVETLAIKHVQVNLTFISSNIYTKFCER